MTLAAAIDRLEEFYGPIEQPLTKPFDIILAENASYLVDDVRRRESLQVGASGNRARLFDADGGATRA